MTSLEIKEGEYQQYRTQQTTYLTKQLARKQTPPATSSNDNLRRNQSNLVILQYMAHKAQYSQSNRQQITQVNPKVNKFIHTQQAYQAQVSSKSRISKKVIKSQSQFHTETISHRSHRLYIKLLAGTIFHRLHITWHKK